MKRHEAKTIDDLRAMSDEDKAELIRGAKSTAVHFQLMMEQASRVMDGFKAEFGTLRCYEIGKLLHGGYWDFTGRSQLEERLKPGVHQKCEGVVKVAVSLAAPVLLEPVDVPE